MLRVYGITYDHTTNYGSCLQAYALQQVIRQIEIGGTLCNYQLIPIQRCEGYPLKSSIVAKFRRHYHGSRFRGFDQQNMRFARIHRLDEISLLNREADAFVCGSDVIWNRDVNRNMEQFYLTFAQKYSFSYAASFGKAVLSEADKKELPRLLGHLKAISVREQSAKEIIEENTGLNSEVVLDPVLLLRADEWNRVAEAPRIRKPYIFIYATHLNDTYRGFVSRLRQQTGNRVIAATWGAENALKQGILQVQTPQRWLQLLRDAEYVITNSFHATAFSVIYHKKFYTVVHGAKDGGVNVRMCDFLNGLGLQDRLHNSIPDMIDLGKPDYTLVDQRLTDQREKSLSWLRQNLEAAFEEKLKLEKKGN